MDDLKTVLRKIELKMQFISILEDELNEKQRIDCAIDKAGNVHRPSAD